MKKLFALLFTIIVLSTSILSGCKGHGNPYLKLPDLVIRLMEEQGLSNCHITYLPEFRDQGHGVEVIIPEERTGEDAFEEARKSGIESIVISWIDQAEFEFDEDEVQAFPGKKHEIKRYLVVGVMGYRKWKNEVPESVAAETDLMRAFELYEEELASPLITKIGYPDDFPKETRPTLEGRGFGFFEAFLGTPVICYLSDEYSVVNDNQVFFALDESSETYLRAKDNFEDEGEKFVVFEIRVSNPDFYPSYMYLVNNGVIYQEGGFHDESVPNKVNPPFDHANVVFKGITAAELTESAFIIVERITIRVEHHK